MKDKEELFREDEIEDIEINESIEDTGDVSYDKSDDEISDDDKFDLIYKLNTNKHRQEGKHRLKNDTIFKGKMEDAEDEIEQGISHCEYNESVNIFEFHATEGEDYHGDNNLNKEVYDLLVEYTDIDFMQSRRKPNKDVFNQYYNMLCNKLDYQYTRSEIFVELAFYFSDNIFNLFKLLDKKPATVIIKELMQKGYLNEIKNINFL